MKRDDRVDQADRRVGVEHRGQDVEREEHEREQATRDGEPRRSGTAASTGRRTARRRQRRAPPRASAAAATPRRWRGSDTSTPWMRSRSRRAASAQLPPETATTVGCTELAAGCSSSRTCCSRSSARLAGASRAGVRSCRVLTVRDALSWCATARCRLRARLPRWAALAREVSSSDSPAAAGLKPVRVIVRA